MITRDDPHFPNIVIGKLYELNHGLTVISHLWDTADLREKMRLVRDGKEKLHRIDLPKHTIVMVTGLDIANDPLAYPLNNNGGIKVNILYKKQELIFNWVYRWNKDKVFPLTKIG